MSEDTKMKLRVGLVYAASWVLCLFLYWLSGEPFQRSNALSLWFIYSAVTTAVLTAIYKHTFEW